jgi:hypothetical protein
MPFVSEPFERCPNCKKLLLPPGMIIFVTDINAPEWFCNTQGDCARRECEGCGDIVNPKHHSQWECDHAAWVRRFHETRKRDIAKRAQLNEQDVLAEAEAILKGEV